MITKKIYTGFIIAIISIFSLPSVAFADEPKDKSSNEVLSRAAEILGVDVVDLENALKNAHAEIRKKKFESKLQEFVYSGKITQVDADEINLWRESKPEGIKSLRKVIDTMKKEGEFKRLSKEDLASKAYCLNKALHAIDVFYEVELPEIFFLEHPLGTVLGRAKYSNSCQKSN